MSDYTDRLYTTRDEAIQREILEVIEVGEATRDQYDVEAKAPATATWWASTRTPSGPPSPATPCDCLARRERCHGDPDPDPDLDRPVGR